MNLYIHNSLATQTSQTLLPANWLLKVIEALEVRPCPDVLPHHIY